ncbi:hypothetical protein GCK72_009413 [Caenorhabditis remanei]|uniref:Uncharacterized protein n=1 Tax=Caenorhabditis remanei TaxID=31234 RepID=A0A6A5H2G4_CAERE|nr:hypothetical protein GCK72_009413 [Caenorhabditis remanei]KAF1761159.1 hypothetical protein GCK72_009413 [Caenorhabditis remanei]
MHGPDERDPSEHEEDEDGPPKRAEEEEAYPAGHPPLNPVPVHGPIEISSVQVTVDGQQTPLDGIQAPTASDPSRHLTVVEVPAQQSPLEQVYPVPHCPLTHPPAAWVPSGQTEMK